MLGVRSDLQTNEQLLDGDKMLEGCQHPAKIGCDITGALRQHMLS